MAEIFEKHAIKTWRRAVHKELRHLRLDPSDPVYPAAMVLATIYGFGTDVAVVSELSGQTPETVRGFLKRLRQQRALSGQTLRVAWNDKKNGGLAWLLDAMVAVGDLVRPVDETRSRAQKARVRTKPAAPRKPRTKIESGTVFRPKVTNSDPLYYLSEKPLAQK